jgi:hypothetical protein
VTCFKCNSPRILSASAKCSDCFSGSLGDIDYNGYVPDDLGIGGEDYMEIDLCLDCGQVQGTWPLPLSKKEQLNDKD